MSALVSSGDSVDLESSVGALLGVVEVVWTIAGSNVPVGVRAMISAGRPVIDGEGAGVRVWIKVGVLVGIGVGVVVGASVPIN